MTKKLHAKCVFLNHLSGMLAKFIHILFLLASTTFLIFPAAAQVIPDSSRQVICVTADGWDSIHGRLTCFERKDPLSPWTNTLSFAVVVGRNGLGWGKGVHPGNTESGPIKKEGDGKSPAGIFKLSAAFGTGAPGTLKNLKLPYLQLSPPIECVDDTASIHYNSIVDRSKVKKVDWNSSEKMLEVGEQYRLGVVVDHNTNPAQPGGGSCIFLHIWSNPNKGTSGCTAMDASNIPQLLQWLDKSKKPLLIQLPEQEYKRLQKNWKLPDVKNP